MRGSFNNAMPPPSCPVIIRLEELIKDAGTEGGRSGIDIKKSYNRCSQKLQQSNNLILFLYLKSHHFLGLML